MKLKRTISAIAALAMSVSCLAGLTITANAALSEVDFIGTSTTAETWDNYTNADEIAKWTSPYTWANPATGNYTFGIREGGTVVAAPADGSVLANNGANYMDGKHLMLTRKNKSADVETATYTLDTSVEDGNVTLETDLTLYFPDDVWRGGGVTLYDKANKAVASLTVASGSGSVTKQNIVLTSNGVTKSSAYKVGVAKDHAYNGLKLKLVIDIDNQTVTCSLLDYVGLDDDNKTKHVTNETLSITKAELEAKEAKIANVNSVSFSMGAIASTATRRIAIDNTKFYANTTVKDSDYDVIYQLADGTKVKEELNERGYSDTTVTISHDPITANDVKYYWVSDDSASKTLSQTEKKIITVTVRKANEYKRTIVSDGDYKGTVLEETMVEGETYKNYWPRYYYDDKTGIVYEVAKQDDHPYYGAQEDLTIAGPTENVTTTLKYNKKYENVVYFKDFDGATANADRFSNGTAVDNIGNGKVGTAWESDEIIPAGTYTAVVAGRGSGRGSKLALGGEAFHDEPSNGTWFLGDEVKDIELKKGGKVSIINGGSKTSGLYDTIVIYGEVADTTITSAKAASESLAVDFTAENTDAKKISGEIEAPTFDSLSNNAKYGDKKIISFEVINPDEATVPVISINNKEYPLTSAQWTGITSTTNSTKTYYAEFVKSSNYEWSQYGTVTVAYGDATAAIDLTK